MATQCAPSGWEPNGSVVASSALDPEGNIVYRCNCTLKIEADALQHTWSYEGQTKEGRFTFEERGATWIDRRHQPEPTKCVDVPDAWGLFTVEHTYEVPSNPAWGWRTKLYERPGYPYPERKQHA